MVRVCHEFVFPFWKGSHAYNKGKALVVSKVPLPDYRADLDERHGSTQKEVTEMFLVRRFYIQRWLLRRLYPFLVD